MTDNSIADPLVENVIVDDVASVVSLDTTAEGAAFVTINRPAKKNALNALVIEGLAEAFETLQGAEGVRVVFVRGAGGTFCAGADLEWMKAAADYSESDNRSDAMALAKMLKALRDIPALTVAIVEGAAMGGGAGLVAACDMAVAVKGARFAFSEVRLGLVPAMISPYVIEAVGARTARALFLTADAFDTETALQVGLIGHILPNAGAVDGFVEDFAKSMVGCAPGAMGEAKRMVEDIAGRPIDHDVMDDTAKLIARIRTGEEGQEGIRAFLERRKPAWAQ